MNRIFPFSGGVFEGENLPKTRAQPFELLHDDDEETTVNFISPPASSKIRARLLRFDTEKQQENDEKFQITFCRNDKENF